MSSAVFVACDQRVDSLDVSSPSDRKQSYYYPSPAVWLAGKIAAVSVHTCTYLQLGAGSLFMPQFLVIAWDGTDAEAGARRAAARPKHLTTAAAMFADGRMREGGAILNNDGQMIGSSCIVEFADRGQLDQWLTSDPYVVENVWQRIEVYPFRCAPR